MGAIMPPKERPSRTFLFTRCAIMREQLRSATPPVFIEYEEAELFA